MRRVLHVIDSLVPGGAERVMATVVRGLCDKGFVQAVHLLDRSGPLQCLIPADCPVFVGGSVASVAASIAAIDAQAIQTWVDQAAVVTAPVAAARGIPLLHRIPSIPSAHYGVQTVGDPHVRRVKVALQSATRVCALSDTAADDAAKYFGLPRPTVIYNGFPLACAPSAPAPLKTPGTFLIVAVGRLAVEKGHRHLIAALPRVIARHSSVRCWIVGTGPCETDLRRHIAERDLETIVTLHGYQEDVRGVLAQADVFVMPSLSEGFGNALLEAMVAGRPIVSSDLAVVRHDILRGEDAAWLVPPGDAPALGHALEGMIADADRRRAFGQRALAASRRFQASRMIDAFAAFLGQFSVGAAA
jgi:glycosyltransferase involved in cell wall biosynthesis